MKNERNTRERPLTALRKQELMEQILAYVGENLAGEVTLRSVSERFRVSVSTVTQLFQKKSSATFHQHLTKLRMDRAVELIRKGVPLEEAGKLVGYTDHSSFYRAFKQTFGVSPREFKQKQITG